uniref:Uncharacterized protein n=1 Tax=Chromera velia CCMP2878 TaxID=1169474 RepID=A0A0G4IC07_9ALVE|eukprot:Cvel_2239.t1-p1 / transcript=Cvel_2239.t1 / gene=Cvel_2239 / organism=Chromera_velia_CCMP2878 / gene_product=hypothetical protein / transcript_product=hypothetical protein / location=Cvel_scaffold86:66703-67554(+) / protein_length=284 / sequence_SO=supercontig / SO=protein_coding / is_pseudo=false
MVVPLNHPYAFFDTRPGSPLLRKRVGQLFGTDRFLYEGIRQVCGHRPHIFESAVVEQHWYGDPDSSKLAWFKFTREELGPEPYSEDAARAFIDLKMFGLLAQEALRWLRDMSVRADNLRSEVPPRDPSSLLETPIPPHLSLVLGPVEKLGDLVSRRDVVPPEPGYDPPLPLDQIVFSFIREWRMLAHEWDGGIFQGPRAVPFPWPSVLVHGDSSGRLTKFANMTREEARDPEGRVDFTIDTVYADIGSSRVYVGKCAVLMMPLPTEARVEADRRLHRRYQREEQ